MKRHASLFNHCRASEELRVKCIGTIVLLLAVAAIAGCVTVTDPVSIGDNKYLLTLNARGGFQSDGELLTQSVQKANSFCQAQGRRAEITNTNTSGVQMWTPQNNQVYLSCVAAQPAIQSVKP